MPPHLRALTIENLLKRRQAQMPPTARTFKLTPKAQPAIGTIN